MFDPDCQDEVGDLGWYGLADRVADHDVVGSVGARVGGMPITRSGSVRPSNGQVNAVAMHSWMAPPTSRAIRTASGIAATLSSVLRPMLALLWESEAEAVLPNFVSRRRPFDVARRDPDPAPVQLVGCQRGDHIDRVGQRRNQIGRAIEPISNAGTPSASSSRAISTLRSVGSIFAVSSVSHAAGRRAGLRAGCRDAGPMGSCGCSNLVVTEAQHRVQHLAGVRPRSGPTLRIGSDAPPITGTIPETDRRGLSGAGVNLEVLDHVS